MRPRLSDNSIDFMKEQREKYRELKKLRKKFPFKWEEPDIEEVIKYKAHYYRYPEADKTSVLSSKSKHIKREIQSLIDKTWQETHGTSVSAEFSLEDTITPVKPRLVKTVRNSL